MSVLVKQRHCMIKTSSFIVTQSIAACLWACAIEQHVMSCSTPAMVDAKPLKTHAFSCCSQRLALAFACSLGFLHRTCAFPACDYCTTCPVELLFPRVRPGGGCGVGVGIGWGFGLAYGTRYIDSKPRFEGVDLARLGDAVFSPSHAQAQAHGHTSKE